MTSPGYIDSHVHIAGISTSGCWFHPQRLKTTGFRIMLRSLGINSSAIKSGLSEALEQSLADSVQESPLARAVVLAFDWARDDQGEPLKELSDFYVPNDYVFQLARTYPKFLSGASIHPYRSDAIEELNRCADAGAVLVKWLPVSQNIIPNDPRCDDFFKELVRLKMPLLCHTGSEGATRNINKAWNDPRLLRRALDAGVTVIAAHSGMRSSPHDRDYFEEWAAMLPDYPHLYGDTAAIFGLRARHFLKVLHRSEIMERLIHGSDWPVPNSPWWFIGGLPLKKCWKLSRNRNPIWRDLATKQALGLPEEVFTRAWNILKLDKMD